MIKILTKWFENVTSYFFNRDNRSSLTDYLKETNMLGVTPFKPDFKNDIEYLNFIIVTEIENFIFRFRLTHKKIITDNNCIEAIDEITRSVLKSISPAYRIYVIGKYINPEAIDEFIIKLITRKVVEIGLDYNKKIYQSSNKDE